MALTGNEVVEVSGVDPLGRPSGGQFLTTTQQIANLANIDSDLALLNGAMTIGSFGDSISNNGTYFPANYPITNIPQWQPGTTYAQNNVVWAGPWNGLYQCTTGGTSNSNYANMPSTSLNLGTIAGGTGYVTGTYNGVSLTGGTGSGATANITVNVSGVVSAVTLVQKGLGYVVGDALSCPNSSLGGTGSGFTWTATQVGTSTTIQDGGTLIWSYQKPQVNKICGPGHMTWLEMLSNYRLRWDMAKGYHGSIGGLIQLIVLSGGSGYASTDTVTLPSGATANLIITNGVIAGTQITNPGYSSTSSGTPTITTSTGSGAYLSAVWAPNGNNAVSGCTSTDCIARLPYLLQNLSDIIIVHIGTNDIGLYVTNYATALSIASTVTANLETIYSSILTAGSKVVAVPLLPRNGMTVYEIAAFKIVNRWIYDFCRKLSYANPNLYTNIVIADPEGFFADGTSTTVAPIGGAGAVSGAMTNDGLHPSNRGSFYFARTIYDAIQPWMGPAPIRSPREYSIANGYDATLNPGGNLFEALPWQASAAYTVGQRVSNNSNIYYCITAGTSASSGGPSGTGNNISDGSVTWDYSAFPSGMSMFMGTSGTLTSAGSVTCSGQMASGFTLSRTGGSAAGTIVGSKESPWSDGQIGQRQRLDFALGSGTVSEEWALTAWFNGYANIGILSSDLGVTSFYPELEIEVSNLNNFGGIFLLAFNEASGSSFVGSNSSSAGSHWPNSNGEMLEYPNNGRLRIRGEGFIAPYGLITMVYQVIFWFDASGPANSSTATIKFNQIGFRKSGVA